MFVCLCNGVTSHTVAEVVAAGAKTTNDVAQACGAGAECGRCRRTVQAILRPASPGRKSSRA
ncbi:MAG TPA: (2Fe-2S)-binding protein [Mycobacterium sp.]